MKKTLFLFFLSLLSFRVLSQDTTPVVVPPIATDTTEGPVLKQDYMYPEEYEIADISVSGLKFLDKNAVVALTGLKVGDVIEIPGDRISNAIKKLWESGILGDVSISASKTEGKKIWLDIEVQERPRLSKVVFEGLKKSEASDLTEKTNLIRGKIVTDAVVKNAVSTIRNYFLEKGFLNVQISTKLTDDRVLLNSSVLTINVKKGAKTRINYIIFEGNKTVSDARLKRAMKKTKERKRFDIFKDLIQRISGKKPLKPGKFLKDLSPTTIRKYLSDHVKINVFASSKFLREDYEADKEKVVAFLNSKGLRDARITFDTVYPYDNRSVNIEIQITEGKKYYYRNIDWAGNFVYDDKTLSEVLGIKKGDLYNPEELSKRLNFNMGGEDVSGLYSDNGYLFFRVEPVEKLIEGDSIDMEMRIYEGAQANVSKVIVEGNTKTNDKVIMRELRTYPGQKFSRSDIIRTQQQLAQLGYFDPEKINILPEPKGNGEEVDIRYRLEEKSNDQLELSGGWGGGLGFIGTLGVSFNNFSLRKFGRFKEEGILPSGDGQRLALRAQANGKQFQTYSLSFTEPWLGGRRRNSFGFSLSHSIQRRFDPTSNKQDGSLKIYAATVSLGRQLQKPDDYFSLSHTLSYLRYNFKNFGNDLNITNGSANNFSFINTLSRNSVDNPIFPRRGSSLTLSVNLTPPYSLFSNRDYAKSTDQERYKLVEFHKWMFDGQWYMPIVGNLTLNMRAHMGFIGSYTSKAGIGPFERFVLGGNGLAGQAGGFLLGLEVIGLRGYQDGQLTPVNSITGSRGGVVYNKFVMELRYPISLNPSATIYALAFMEGGNNWDDYRKFNPFSIYRSVGVGARIFMPAFGLIGLDYGYGFDEIPGKPDANGGQFHFTIGQQIR